MANEMSARVTLHVVMSLDGFIAKSDNTVAWMDNDGGVYEKGVGFGDGEMPRIDCYVLGSRTYEHALELGWPYGDTPTVVVTSRELPRVRESVEFYAEDLKRLVGEVLAPQYGNIWLVGGAELAQSFLRLDLVDELWLMIVPVTLGEGLSLFGDTGVEQGWRLTDVVAYRNGWVELAYGRRANGA